MKDDKLQETDNDNENYYSIFNNECIFERTVEELNEHNSSGNDIYNDILKDTALVQEDPSSSECK